MTFKIIFAIFFALPIFLGGCAFPGQVFDIDPSSVDKRGVFDGIDFSFTTLDSVALSSLNQSAQNHRLVKDHVGDSSVYVYKVGVGDLIRVTVWDHPELTNPAGNTTGQLQGQTVLPDGTFYFPFLGKVNAVGRTTDQIRADMALGLEKFIRNPQVDVYIQPNGFRSQRIYVSGEVSEPGFFPITDVPVRLSDALALAGGVTRDADLNSVTIQRDNKTLYLNAYQLIYEGDLTQNLLLQHGDVLNVPDRRLRKVFLMGEVVRPSSFVMPIGKLSLAEVLSDIGGINQNTANAQQVYVIRQSVRDSGPQSDRVLNIYHLDSTSPTSVIYADQFEMQPRDVVYVDPVQMIRVNRLLGTILPSLQILPAVRSNIRVLEGE